MAGALLRAKRTGEVIIRVSNVGAVLPVQSHLEEVRKRAAVAVGAVGSVSANSSGVNEVVTGSVLRESWDRGIAIHALRRIYIPLCPTIDRSVGASGLHRGEIV